MPAPVAPSPDLLAEAHRTALSLATEARAIVCARLDTGFAVRRKADRSLVTDIDLAIEERVRAQLAVQFPDHAVLGEELGLTPGSQRGARHLGIASEGARHLGDGSEGGGATYLGDDGVPEWLWVVDPVDGTHSLRHRVPLFGFLLALLWRGRPVVGLIDLPLLGRRLSGVVGSGAWIDDRPHRLADLGLDEPLADEIVATGERPPFVAAGLAEGFDRLMAGHPRTRTYCDCFGHALALGGEVGAMVDVGLRLWDLAATVAIARAAGAAVALLDASHPPPGSSVSPTVDAGPPAVDPGAGLVFPVDPARRHHLVVGKPAVVAYALELMLPDGLAAPALTQEVP